MMPKLRTAVLSLAACLGFAAAASAQTIVINEIVYDSAGTDLDTWCELKGEPGMSLDGYLLVGVNGNGGVDYATINLNGFTVPADGYFVIAQRATSVPDPEMVSTSVDFQNGPDSVQLRKDTGSGIVVIDALGYQTHGGTDVFAGEGAPAPDQTSPASLIRCPDGFDSQNNAVDFVLDTTPTPGTPNDGTCAPPVPTDVTVCQVAADDANGVPVLNTQFVRFEGICIVPSGIFSGPTLQEFAVTDDNGTCCMSVFGGAITPFVNIGDRVRIVGTVTNFNGRTEVTSPNLTVTILSSGNPVPAPVPVTTFELSVNGEIYESCVVQLNCVDITSGTWPLVGENQNLIVDDGTGPTTMRVDKDTDIPGSSQPTGPFTAVGMATQFDSTSPFSDGYQLQPRSLADLIFNCAAIQGACCFNDGSCSVLGINDCDAQGGIYQGNDTVCDPNPCPQPGACCFANGSCELRVVSDCLLNGGTFMDGPCDPNPCPQPEGACCFPNGTCQIVTGDICAANGGTFFGPTFNCDPNPCPQPFAACCLADGTCFVLTNEECNLVGGTWRGKDASCDPNPCPLPAGACCYPDGSCFVQTSAECGGTYFGDNTVCDPNPCPQPMGACCFADGSCTVRTQSDCEGNGGIFQGANVPCNPNPCPQPIGACCFADGSCVVSTGAECQGQYQGNGTVCDPNPCPQPPDTGACCLPTGECLSGLTAAGCEQLQGEYQGNDTLCEPNPCEPPVPTEKRTWGGIKKQYR
ncbi:MAG: hypothetical protein IT349_02330 [Candidatus Eisenbacteria bacterium]|nr:hypothetical protein [Candidatus Eisenbacteria bacterium]MCC7140916.1 hypothetical protein [Candidatus Eisenbacteria bacterium]